MTKKENRENTKKISKKAQFKNVLENVQDTAVFVTLLTELIKNLQNLCWSAGVQVRF